MFSPRSSGADTDNNQMNTLGKSEVEPDQLDDSFVLVKKQIGKYIPISKHQRIEQKRIDDTIQEENFDFDCNSDDDDVDADVV